MTTIASKTSFSMAGTEGTGEYMVPVATALGAVGFRCLSQSTFRVRVEPSAGNAAVLADSFPADSWKQPGQNGQDRFSTMVHGGYEELRRVLDKAVTALTAGGQGIELNGDAPQWVRSAVEQSVRASLVAQVKSRKVPGANLASRWSLPSLVAKLA